MFVYNDSRLYLQNTCRIYGSMHILSGFLLNIFRTQMNIGTGYKLLYYSTHSQTYKNRHMWHRYNHKIA